jgi:hypothetical protein
MPSSILHLPVCYLFCPERRLSIFSVCDVRLRGFGESNFSRFFSFCQIQPLQAASVTREVWKEKL